MSITLLHLIPKDPHFSPAQAATEAAQDWLQQLVPEAALPGGYFDSLAVTMACCSAQTDLNALDYVELRVFARYGLVTTNPECELPLPLPPASVQALEVLLATDLRQVIAGTDFKRWLRYTGLLGNRSS